MPKHVEKATIYDPRVGTNRSVTLEVSAPQFILDIIEEGVWNSQLIAQEAFDQVGRKFTIEVSVRLPKRG